MSRTNRAYIDGQFDLFLPYMSDLLLRDQREVMERPFFSLAKSKRLKPIDYTSPDGKVWVHVSGNPDYGMATIWDADILIYCASVVSDMKRRGINDIPRTLNVMPYDLLRAIGRPTTGRAYELLGMALDRLQSTTVKTNIRAETRREATFSWLDSWTQLVDEKTERSRGMALSLSSWFYDGLMMEGGVLAIDPSYFDITGGLERWLYRVARKHAGGAGEGGFAISLPTLFDKSGSEGVYRRFKFEISALAKKNALPGFLLAIEHPTGKAEPSLRMRRRRAGDLIDASAVKSPRAGAVPTPNKVPEPSINAALEIRKIVGGLANRAAFGFVSDETREHLRSAYPGWDFDSLHGMFKEWLGTDSTKTPVNYQRAFIGFVKRYDEKNRHTLPGR